MERYKGEHTVRSNDVTRNADNALFKVRGIGEIAKGNTSILVKVR